MRLLTILALIASTPAAAADGYVAGALGVFNSGKNSLSETKMVEVGTQSSLGGPFASRLGIGGWVDNAGGGRGDSAFASYQLGFTCAAKTLEAHVFVGPAFITSPDSYLGGPLEFTEDFYLGMRGVDGTGAGVFYKHMSSAGIYQPNVGRDFLGVEIRFPLW